MSFVHARSREQHEIRGAIQVEPGASGRVVLVIFNSEERNRLRAAEAERNLVKHFCVSSVLPLNPSFSMGAAAAISCMLHSGVRSILHELPFLLLSRPPPCQQPLGPPLSGSALFNPLRLNHVLERSVRAARIQPADPAPYRRGVERKGDRSLRFSSQPGVSRI